MNVCPLSVDFHNPLNPEVSSPPANQISPSLPVTAFNLHVPSVGSPVAPAVNDLPPSVLT